VVLHLTLEDAKQRALANNKLLNLAGMNAQSKAFAIKAAQADYFPKISATALYLHFNDNLGTVLSTQGRTVSGPLGRPLVTFPATTTEVAVLNQDSSAVLVGAVQPITDLLKVRQGVKIAQADQQIAQAEVDKGVRDLVSGVEQLYWGLLAARQIQAGAREAVEGTEKLAKTGALEARAALVEARQALQQVDKQVADVQEQLNALLDVPLCTVLDLVEPPLPELPYRCADEAAALAVAVSPEVRSAQQTIVKAEAGVKAGKLDYMPSIAAIGGYVNQTAASYIQQDFAYVGVMGTWTLVDWGKRRNVVHERETLLHMAGLKLSEVQDKVRQDAAKAFREVGETRDALALAQEMAKLRKEAEKKATAPVALMEAVKARMLADVEVVKAELAYREAFVKLMALTGGH
jgi:outer membrane protein TolC